MSRHILFVTGTRADFGKLEPLAAAARDAGFRVGFFVTGMHMLDRYGLTKLEVRRMPGVEVTEFLNQREGDPQDMIFAKTVIGFSDHVRQARPDLIVVHGDRVEAMATAFVAATNNLRCAHVEGGEVSGTIDEVFRHCNTKLATLHLVSSQTAAARVRAMGEAAAAVAVIGSPELDSHARPSGVSLDEVRARYAIPFAEYGIAVFHPVTSEPDIGAQAAAFFATLEASGRAFVVIHPNNDPGCDAILATIEALPAERFRALPSMRFAYFSQLLRDAACVVGNSSAGVREAPFLGIPSLDVGTRQTNRARGPSLSRAAARDAAAIGAFLAREWGRRYPRDTQFGQGDAASAFARLLAADTIWSQPLQKRFHDRPDADHDGGPGAGPAAAG
ncbi:MAG: UDP-N-acetylglucosamine 2-epimerase [Alkalilacustris sp.]